MSETAPHIGTLMEKPLHASLKEWYHRPSDLVESLVEGFVVDLVRDGLLIEIQTRGFSSMKQKLSRLLDLGHVVRIVHPVPVDKWITKLGADGEVISRRLSPRHGVPVDVFSELVSFPELLVGSGLEVEVLLTVEEEYRRHSPGMAWRRKGWVVVERRLLEVLDSIAIDGADDLLGLLPEALPDVFTTADLAEGLGRPRRLAQQMAYCLAGAGVLSAVGKLGNSVQYAKRAEDVG